MLAVTPGHCQGGAWHLRLEPGLRRAPVPAPPGPCLAALIARRGQRQRGTDPSDVGVVEAGGGVLTVDGGIVTQLRIEFAFTLVLESWTESGSTPMPRQRCARQASALLAYLAWRRCQARGRLRQAFAYIAAKRLIHKGGHTRLFIPAISAAAISAAAHLGVRRRLRPLLG